MKGKGIGRFFSDLVKPLRRASVRDHLDLRPSTKEFTFKNLVELQVKMKMAEEHLETLKRVLEDYEKVDTSILTAEELNEFLIKKAETKKLVEDLEKEYAEVKEATERETKKNDILRKRTEAEKEHNEAANKINEAITEFVTAYESHEITNTSEAYSKLYSLIATTINAKTKLATLALDYKNLTEEDLEFSLANFSLSETKVRELYRKAAEEIIKLKEDERKNSPLITEIERYIGLLKNHLADKSFDFDKMKVEVDTKLADKYKKEDPDKKEIEEINKDIAELTAVIAGFRSVSPEDPDLKAKSQVIVDKVNAFSNKYKENSKLELSMDEDTVLEIKPLVSGILPYKGRIFTPAQIAKLVPPTRTADPVGPSESEPSESEEEKARITEVNNSIDALSGKIAAVHAIPADSSSLSASYTDLTREIAKFISKYMLTDLVRIKYNDKDYELTIEHRKDGVKDLSVHTLTPEQIAVVEAARKGTPEPTPATKPAPAPVGESTGAPTRTDDSGRPTPKPTPAPASKPEPKPADMEAAKNEYLQYLKELNLKISIINSNNEMLSRMVTYNPDEMELEIETEKNTYQLEKEVLNDQLALSRMRMDYYNKFKKFLLSDPDILAAKQEEIIFESSKNLDAFVEMRNVKIVNAENDIIELSSRIEELKTAAEPGYALKVTELENKIKLLQSYIRTQNSIVQRRLVAEGKSIDIADYYSKRNERMKELRAAMKKGAPVPTPVTPKPTPVTPEPTKSDEEEKKIVRESLAIKYASIVNEIVKRVREGDSTVELKVDLINSKDLEKYKEINEEMRSKYAEILANRVKEEQLDAILSVYQQLAAFYKKTIETKTIPTEEEVKKFCEGIDKHGLKCDINYDLSVNRFTFKYTHKELNLKTTRYVEKERVNNSICIYDKKLGKKPSNAEIGIREVRYNRKSLSFSPNSKAQKVDTEVATLVKNLSKIEIVRVKNTLKISYTKALKEQLERLKANIKVLNTKKADAKQYNVQLGAKPESDGKYTSEVVLRGQPNINDYALEVGFQENGRNNEIQLDFEEKTRSR